MVMPRSRSRSMVSRTWSRIWRRSSVPVASMSRSARVDLPWSMWAMMQKLRMCVCDIPGNIGAEWTEGRKDGKTESDWTFRPSVLPSFRLSSRMPRPAGRLSAHDLEMLLVTVIWGGNFSVSKFALERIPPLPFSALRFLFSSVLLLLIARRAGVAASLPRRTLRWLIALGVVGNTIYQTAFMTGLSITSATNSAMIIASLPVVVALLGAVLGVERSTPALWLGVVLGTAGVALVVAARGVHFSADSLRGDLLVLFAVLCWSFYMVGVRRAGAGVNPLWITAITAAAGTPGLVLLGLPGLVRLNWSEVTPKHWAAFAYAALFSLVLSYVLYNRAVQAIGSGRTALYNCLTPLVAMLIAWLTLGEVPTGVQFAGMALVIVGVLVSVTASSAVPSGVPE